MVYKELTRPRIELRSYDAQWCRHSHEYAQIVLPLNGAMAIEIGNCEGSVTMETAAFIPQGEQHRFAGSKGNLFAVIDLPQQNIALNGVVLSSFFNLTVMTKKFLEFAHFYLIENQNDNFCDSMVQDLLLNLISQPLLVEQDRFVALAKNWINLYFACPVNVGELARLCHLSVSQLQRRFKRCTGFGIAEYWRITRLESAKKLLSNVDSSIESIAFKVGYESAAAFSRCFHKTFAISPSQWRHMTLTAKNMRGEDKVCLVN